MPRRPLTIPELRATPEQRAAQLERARKYCQQHIAPIDKLWGECERRTKERMMETINAAPEVDMNAPVAMPPLYVIRFRRPDGQTDWGTRNLESQARDLASNYAESYIFGPLLPTPQPAPERPLAERVAELETIVQSILRREAEDIVAQHEQPAPAAPSVGDVLDRLREQVRQKFHNRTKGEMCGNTLDAFIDAEMAVLALIDAARREAGK